MSIEGKYCVDRQINCGCCGNEIWLIGDISQEYTHMDGHCMKCGWVVYTTTDFLSLDQVNQWRECQEEDLKQIDNQYLYTNRFKNVSLKEKILELGYMDEEQLERFIEQHNSHIFDKSISWDFCFHKGRIDREYGKLKMKQSVQNTPKNRPSESQQNQGVKSSDLGVQKGNVL